MEKTGLRARRRLSSSWRHTPGIRYTMQRSLQAGMNAHLNKPVESDHLYQTLEELIYEAETEDA